MKKTLLLMVFFLVAPTIVLALTFTVLIGSYTKRSSMANSSPKVAFAALPIASGTLKSEIKSEDGRVLLVSNFFKKYKSDLFPFANDVIVAADKYGLDYRLIPAIAMQESNLCKKIPIGSHNCWGFGIYGKKVTKFVNYSEAIDTVTKTLAKQYKENGLETAEEIMKRYTPNSNGSWAHGVNHFMDELATNL